MEPELDSTCTKLNPRPSWANSSLTIAFLMHLALTHTPQGFSVSFGELLWHAFPVLSQYKVWMSERTEQISRLAVWRDRLIPCQAVHRVLVWKQTPAMITERFLIQPCRTHVNSSSTLQKISLINQLSSIMCSLVVRLQPLSINSSAHTYWTPLGLSNCSYTWTRINGLLSSEKQ